MLLLVLVLMVGCDATETPQKDSSNGTESNDAVISDSVYNETTASPDATDAPSVETEQTNSPETTEAPRETAAPEPETTVAIPETTVSTDTDKVYPGLPNDLEPDFGA